MLSSTKGAPSSGPCLREIMGDLDSTKKTSIVTKVNNLGADGSTPLGETLFGIGKYFTTGYTGSLTLHPGQGNQTTASVANVFQNAVMTNDSGQAVVAPIQYSCQKNFALLLTDGRPTLDTNISSTLNHYWDGDADILDDIAKALYDGNQMNLRPDLTSTNNAKANVRSYLIGFANDTLYNDPLLQETATNGGGQFLAAANSSALASALQNVAQAVLSQVGTSSATASSVSWQSDTALYQGRYDGNNWSGGLLSIPVQQTTGNLGSANWDAGCKLSGASPCETTGQNVAGVSWDTGRAILTLKPGVGGVPFRWGSLDTTQQGYLNLHPITQTNDGYGSQRLEFLRGDHTNEKSGTGLKLFRDRIRAAYQGSSPGNFVLGDIVNSDPTYVGAPAGVYNDPTYVTFMTNNANRTPVIYAGANDGMLHGFRASNGAEVLAYVPSPALPRMNKLTDVEYGSSNNPHVYYVDGPTFQGDVKYGNAWHTLLVGSLGAGGQGIYALDVTNPSSFSETSASSIVKWEFTDSYTYQGATQTAGDPDLGYVLGQPTIAKLKNGQFGVIFGNGYHNLDTSYANTSASPDGNPGTTGHAVLFILNAETGAIIKKIDTKVGSTTNPNGLSTPAVVDNNSDGVADYIYAGDLQGNLWKFDVSDTSPSNWGIPYPHTNNNTPSTPAPLFTAVDTASHALPITARPQVGFHPTGEGYMVYFGTGQYFEVGDNVSHTAPFNYTQTFYGIWDRNDTTTYGFRRCDLLQQSVLSSGSQTVNGSTWATLITSQLPIIWRPAGPLSVCTSQQSDHLGWYFNLTASTGERVVYDAILQNGRIIFTSVIPFDSDPCSSGATGYLYELDPSTGGRLKDQPLIDLNCPTCGGECLVNCTSCDTPPCLPPTPPPIVDMKDGTERKYISGQAIKEKAGASPGHQSWRQVQ
ncbi:type IV pilus assembly protein PilY1 [Gammaproteobacteria bacterium]